MTSALSLLAALAAATPAAAEAPQTQGVTAYPAAYFASTGANTALDMVNRLPGFSLDSGDSVRGFEGAAGNVLIDGSRPVSKTDDIEEILKRIPAGQVERIDVIRGGAPGIDMQGKSILANVVRSKTAGRQIVFALADQAVFDDGRHRKGVRLELTDHIGPGAFEGSLRYGEGLDDGAGDGPHLKLSPAGAVLEKSQVDSHGEGHMWVATGAYELPALGGKLRINGRIYEDYYRFNELNWFTVPRAVLESNNDTQDDRQTEVGVRWTRPLGDRTTLELIGLRQTHDINYKSDFRSPPDVSYFGLEKLIEERIGRAVLKHRLTDNLSVEVGAENAFNTLDSRTVLTFNGRGQTLPAANVHVEENRSEAFAKSVWRPVDSLTLEAGLRYETSDVTSTGDVVLEKSLHFLKPRLFASWTPWDGGQLRLRYERTVSQLDFDDFVATSSLNTGVLTSGNPDLDPEQAWVSEIAFEQRFWKNGSAAVTLRHSDLKDAIDRAPVFSPGGTFDAPANIGDGTKDELGLNLTVPTEPLGVRGGQFRGEVTWINSEVTDPSTRKTREMSNQKPVIWEAHYVQDLPQWRSSVGTDIWGGWRKSYYRFDQVYTDKLKTYVVLFGEYKPRPDFTVRLELHNITERGMRHIQEKSVGVRGGTPLAYVDDRDIQFGRSLYVRLRKTF